MKEQDYSSLAGIVRPERDLWPEIRDRIHSEPTVTRSRIRLSIAAAAAVFTLAMGFFLGVSYSRTNALPSGYKEQILLMDAEYRRLKPLVLNAAAEYSDISPEILDRLEAELDGTNKFIWHLLRTLPEKGGEAEHYALVINQYRRIFKVLEILQEWTMPSFRADWEDETPFLLGSFLFGIGIV
jgi:hypothetical protein